MDVSMPLSSAFEKAVRYHACLHRFVASSLQRCHGWRHLTLRCAQLQLRALWGLLSPLAHDASFARGMLDVCDTKENQRAPMHGNTAKESYQIPTNATSANTAQRGLPILGQ
jgi:hypothetical protein